MTTILDNEFTQDATFAGYQSAGFNSKNKFTERDTMAVKTGGNYDVTRDFSPGAQISTRLLNTDSNDVTGNLSTTWRF